MYYFKTILSIFAIVGATTFNICYSQTIVGKWKMISSTSYFTAEGAAKQGKTFLTHSIPATESIISEFKSDHTYITTTTSSAGATPDILSGNWSLTGEELTITIDPKYKPSKELQSSTINISIKGNTMIMTNNIVPNAMVSKMTTMAERI